MVMVTLDIPKQINKGIEHFKIEKELKDKRDAIIKLLEQGLSNGTGGGKTKDLSFEELFRKADTFKRHDLTPKQIEAMDSDIYD